MLGEQIKYEMRGACGRSFAIQITLAADGITETLMDLLVERASMVLRARL
jgi:hypothetical protein